MKLVNSKTILEANKNFIEFDIMWTFFRVS